MRRAAQAGQAVMAVGWGWLRPDFLSSDGHSQIPDGQQDLDTLSMAVPVPEPEEIVQAHRKPWKGGTEVTPFKRVASKNHDFAHSV